MTVFHIIKVVKYSCYLQVNVVKSKYFLINIKYFYTSDHWVRVSINHVCVCVTCHVCVPVFL